MPQENNKIKEVVLKSGYKLTAVGEIPVDWEVSSLDELAVCRT